MSWRWAHPRLSQPPALGLELLGPHPPGIWPLPPASALPSQLSQAWVSTVPSLTFQFSVVQELLKGHCRERRGRGRGLSQGGKGGCGEGQEPGGAGLDSLVSLPSAQPKLDPSSGGRALSSLSRPLGSLNPPGL